MNLTENKYEELVKELLELCEKASEIPSDAFGYSSSFGRKNNSEKNYVKLPVEKRYEMLKEFKKYQTRIVKIYNIISDNSEGCIQDIKDAEFLLKQVMYFYRTTYSEYKKSLKNAA